MTRQIQIGLRDRDVTARIELCDDTAPNASDLLWGILQTPFVGRAVHAIYAGPAVLIAIPQRHGEPRGGQIPVENETQRPPPGAVLLLPPVADDAEDIWGEPGAEAGVTVAVFYGRQGRPFTPSGWQPGVVAGRVSQGLKRLREACRRVRFEGAQEVHLGREPSGSEVASAILFSDGASLGNPGPAGAGFVLTAPDGRLLAEGSVPLEPTTVNVAEYRALIAGLHEACRQGVTRLQARMDSLLLVKQLTGEYRVKAPHLRPLYQWAGKLINKLDSFSVAHVPREENQRADELAGDAARRSREQNADDGE
ncbi:MAG: DUF3830 family protein [Armatimonadota bacterium]|nr:DUF3830 family protein [Armatimonadota bacterium]